MTRLIDADAVYKILESCEIRKATIGNPLTDWEYGYTCGIERAESEIECTPTIDAVPVIRCKDCMWFSIDQLKSDGTPDMRCKPTWCSLHRTYAKAEFFCSWAEKEENNEA